MEPCGTPLCVCVYVCVSNRSRTGSNSDTLVLGEQPLTKDEVDALFYTLMLVFKAYKKLIHLSSKKFLLLCKTLRLLAYCLVTAGALPTTR